MRFELAQMRFRVDDGYMVPNNAPERHLLFIS